MSVCAWTLQANLLRVGLVVVIVVVVVVAVIVVEILYSLHKALMSQCVLFIM